MPNAAELKGINNYQYRGLYVGRSGSGKKGAACSFPHKMYYFDIDERIKGLTGCSWIDLSKIDYDSYSPHDPQYLQKIDKKLEKIVNDDIKGNPEYAMIVFASITGFTNGLMPKSLDETHEKKGDKKTGKFIGDYAVPGPEDYGFEKIVTHQIINAIRRLKNTHFIVTAHEVARFGKSDPKNPYSDSIEIGSKLNITDKLGEFVLTHFNEIYGFRKNNVGTTKVEHLVRFRSDMYRTSYAKLPSKEIDITDVNFYEKLKPYME